MLSIKDDLKINKYAQGLLDKKELLQMFNAFNEDEKRNYLEEMLFLISQSKPQEEDIILSIKDSGLRETYTPCVMLKKGVASYLLRRLIELPQNETEKTFILLLSLFKMAYLRRFENEKNDPNKWWYWDFSDKKNLEKLMKEYKI